ncbi:MAG: TonB-dependent receptor [Bryobacteraceae bacterium]|nr:carboxypeptidase-like regulatory domain-containing protein [Bryobacterales bacterium]MEB2360786.1 carboxypeptidase-like regulatory domain-containing protein [Bryobacterales bacterium]NUN01367.1 TonB-dependent receptor [Bryobacteraceae bacterium]
MAIWLRAQDARGSIVGRVADPSDAVIAGAEVRATNVATGVAAVTRTNDAGNYVLAYLLPGRYTVEVEIAGFKKFVRQGIEVRVSDTVTIDALLEIGSQAETVQVTAETPLLETADASMGQVVDERRIAELPSFGGAPYNLTLMAPGTINSTNLRQRYVGTPGAQGDFAVDGAGMRNNEFTIDGVANSLDKGIVFVPPQMSVSEFKVQSVSYDASIGHTAGALVNVSLKSGTNDLHGEAHWFVRNRIFDTPTLFQNRVGQEVPPYQDHRYGVSGGGPVKIPKLYNGTNRTFWFYLWEANKVQYAYDFQNTVPTAEMRRGDLSPLLALGANYQVYDPATTVFSGGRFTRQPFPNNIIPANRLDPVAQKIMEYWPAPNQTGTREFRNNHFVSYAGPFPVWTHLGRFDHSFNPNHRIYARVMREGFWSASNKRFLSDYDGMQYNQDKWGFALDDVYVFNPEFFMNLRYGFTYRWGASYKFSRGFDLATLGFSPNLISQLPDKSLATFPYVGVGSFTPLSGNGTGGKWAGIINSLNANFTKLSGHHNFRFGLDFRNYREFNNIYTTDVSPVLSFANTYTKATDISTAAPVGAELAAFLLGVPGGYMDRSGSYAQQENYWGLYIHDDIKLTSKLTVNAGVRYEFESPITERFNRSVAHFAYDQPSPIEAQARANYAANPIPEIPVSDFRVRGGLTFAGTNGNPRALWSGEKNNLMPRIGIAYHLVPKTVLRAGYGIFFDTIGLSSVNSIQTGFSMRTPIQASLDSGLTYIATTANPFPNGLTPPLGAAGGLATNLGQAISFFAENRKNPYSQRWSLGIQQLLPAQYMIDVSYVGNRGTRLPVSRNLNALPARYLSTLPVRDNQTIAYLGQSFKNPFAGTNPIYGANITRSGLLLPYPQFGSVTVSESIGYSWYHSMQIRMEKRFSKSYTLQLSYTWAKTMDATGFLNASDPMPYESISTQDRTHRIVVSGIWELPFGRGRRIGANLHRAVDFFAGGWQLNGMVQRQSGPPLEWGDVWTLFTGDPNAVKLSKDQRSVDRWFNVDAGFNRNSAQQLASNIRRSPWRFSNLRADGQARWDFSLFKNFRITEQAKMQFRAECINAWNHPNLFAPVMTPTSSTFGMVTNQDATRTWVMSLKLSF